MKEIVSVEFLMIGYIVGIPHEMQQLYKNSVLPIQRSDV